MFIDAALKIVKEPTSTLGSIARNANRASSGVIFDYNFDYNDSRINGTIPSSTFPPFFQRIGKCLYRKGGAIYARVRVNGKPTWRSTGTNIPADAQKWLEKWRREEWALKYGIETIILHRSRVTANELIDNYVNDGMRTRKGRLKSPATVKNEQACLKPLRAYFGSRPAAVVSLANCDKYRDWRTSGGYEQRWVEHPALTLN